MKLSHSCRLPLFIPALTLFFLLSPVCSLIAGDIIDGEYLPKQKIIVGGDEDYPPYTYLDEKGEPKGLDVDIIKHIAVEMNLELEFRFTQWGTAIDNLKSGKIDVILGISYSTKRKPYFDYTIPHTTEYHAIFVRKDSGIDEFIDLANKTMIIQKGDSTYETSFKPYGFENPVVTIDSIPEAISQLNAGRHDFLIAPYSIGMEAISMLDANRLKTIGPPILPNIFRFAVKKGNSGLLTVLNDGLDKLKADNGIHQIQKNWIKYDRRDTLVDRILHIAIYIIIPLILVILLLVVWSKMLKKEVQKKSKSLSIAKKEAEFANAAKSDFMAKLSHEIRTPLNSILGNCQILKDIAYDDQDKNGVSYYLRNIEISSNTLLMLVKDVLDLSKIEAGKIDLNIEVVDLHQLILDIYNMNKEIALENEIILNYAVDTELPESAYLDRSMMVKIISNILSNSIKFTPAGKNIWLKARYVKGSLAIQIQDEGIGISPDKLNTIFEPFEQTGEKEKKFLGTGLGLTIVRENVKRLGGNVDIESEIDKGSCFSVNIPLENNQPQA